MKLLYRALNDLWYQYGSWLHFSLDYIGLLQLLLNYRNKLVYFWWKATVPLNFQIWALFVDDWMDGSWWRCCQWEREKTPTRWWDWSSWPLKKALPILSHKDFSSNLCQGPSLCLWCNKGPFRRWKQFGICIYSLSDGYLHVHCWQRTLKSDSLVKGATLWCILYLPG